jgi:hypothetical protein
MCAAHGRMVRDYQLTPTEEFANEIKELPELGLDSLGEL